MPDTLPQLLRALVSAFHRDAATGEVDYLASEFTAQVARYLYETKSRERTLCVMRGDALCRYLTCAADGIRLGQQKLLEMPVGCGLPGRLGKDHE